MSCLTRSLVLRSICKRCMLTEPCTTQGIRYNSNVASITRTHRVVYERVYPTTVVLPDGATITIRYSIPRKIIKLPINLDTLSPEELAARLARRKPKQKIILEEDIEDTFDVNKYSHLWKAK